MGGDVTDRDIPDEDEQGGVDSEGSDKKPPRIKVQQDLEDIYEEFAESLWGGVHNVLRVAEQEKYNSIAFPILSTSMPKEVCARTMIECLIQYF